MKPLAKTIISFIVFIYVLESIEEEMDMVIDYFQTLFKKMTFHEFKEDIKTNKGLLFSTLGVALTSLVSFILLIISIYMTYVNYSEL